MVESPYSTTLASSDEGPRGHPWASRSRGRSGRDVPVLHEVAQEEQAFDLVDRPAAVDGRQTLEVCRHVGCPRSWRTGPPDRTDAASVPASTVVGGVYRRWAARYRPSTASGRGIGYRRDVTGRSRARFEASTNEIDQWQETRVRSSSCRSDLPRLQSMVREPRADGAQLRLRRPMTSMPSRILARPNSKSALASVLGASLAAANAEATCGKRAVPMTWPMVSM
jgi:hypothetical protein